MADAWVLSLFPSPEAFWAFCCSLWLLLLAFACFSMMPRAKPQEGRTRRRRYRRNQENCRVWDVHDSSQPSRKPCPKHPELDGVPRLAQLFNTILEDLNRYIEMYNFEITEGTDDSLSPISTTETSSSSGMSLSSGRKNSCTSVVKMGAPCSSKASLSSCSNVSLTSVLDMEPCCSSRDSLSAWSDNSLAAIVATKDSGSSEAPLTPCKDDSHTYTRVSEGASQLSLTALLDGADMVQASTVQPCLLPSTVPEEQHDMGTHPSCTKEVASFHRADRVQQQQKQLRDQQGAPTPPPLVPDSQSRETEVQQKHLQDQQGAPTPPPLVPDSQSRETEVEQKHLQDQQGAPTPPPLVPDSESRETEVQQKQLQDQQGAPTPPPLVPDSQSRETEVEQKHLQDQQGAPTPSPLVPDSESRETEVQQKQLQDQQGAPTPPPLVPDSQSRETEVQQKHLPDQQGAPTPPPLVPDSESRETEVEQKELQDQQGAPTPPPLVPDSQSREMEVQQKQLWDQQGAPTPPSLEPDSQSRETEVQQKHLQDQQGAPTPPPLVPDSQSRETEVPLPHQETQETVHCLAPRRKEEVKLELPTDGVGPQQHSPASVPQTPQRPPKPNVIVIPMVKDIPFLDEAVKRQLERHIVKRQIQRRFGLPTKVLAYEKDFLEPILEQQESQPLSLQRCIGQPYHSPFQKRDRCTTKSAVCPPGLQQESAARKNTCTRGTQTPAQSVPAAIPRVAQGMPQKDGKRPHWKRESGGTARSSSMTSKKTLPCTKKKDQGSGTESDGQGTSPSIQEEQAPPLSKGAPQGQSEQDCVSPTISTETQELQLEKNVPTGEAEHSQEGQSGIGGDVGTPELPSNRTSPSRSSPPQTQHCSDGTPSALPMPQDSAGTSILTPYLEELLMTLMDCYTARTAAENLQNQLLALWLEKNSSTDQAAKHPVASPRRRPKESQKGKRHTQGGAGSRRPCPKCSSSLHHNLPGSVGSQPSAPSEAATPGAGRNRTAGERHPPKERAKRKQGQKVTAADTQQPEGIRVYRKLILIPPVEEERLPSQRAPAWTLPSGTWQLPRHAAARHRNHRAETPPLPGSLCCVLTPILLCLQCAWDTLRDAGKALLARIKK
ncbi:mediator of DNA damage checkpoint protein 1-like isoform X2 [Anser cygnoides]|uniref:mediator of DNA damage checkpoint protein 1-like isoform X2 n=1 Tax=Anser cygnoides TaxID=8845 RepID=UPI0034D2E347